eukprot:CAMPEP_0175094206 /NCGR_PEP_ID=MMETSP0086_2-20121207/3457_1 /TAXON_ID=136419 /ORGANISM="Unknown Unknown, Strain D1" /LENGTH=198 /DNA_ID=CAMNT_0016367289 /DNA_START=116 /DNA_END=712 /DNA_ORIENTATION=-
MPGVPLISLVPAQDEEVDAPSDYDGDPDDYFEELRTTQEFPFSDSSGSFKVVSQAWLFYCFEFLCNKDLLPLCSVNKLWRAEMENSDLWDKRCRAYLGHRYEVQMEPREKSGWTDKQFAVWVLCSQESHLVSSESQRFQRQMNLWSGIIRERKRNFLQHEKEQLHQVEEDSSKKLKQTNGTNDSALVDPNNNSPNIPN